MADQCLHGGLADASGRRRRTTGLRSAPQDRLTSERRSSFAVPSGASMLYELMPKGMTDFLLLPLIKRFLVGCSQPNPSSHKCSVPSENEGSHESETPSSPCAAIVSTARGKAVRRKFPLHACPARGSASTPGHARRRYVTKADSGNGIVPRLLRRLRQPAALRAGCDPPGSGQSPSLRPGRSKLVPA